jgi:threonyl-tRNA synthetase
MKNLDFEPLDVSGDVALKMFEDNKYKTKVLKQLLDNSGRDSISVYRMGDYVDFNKGPLISNTSQIHRYSVTSVS